MAELGGEGHSDPLVGAFYSSLAIYEQTLSRGRANYLRRKLTKLGGGVEAVKQILIDWCTDKGMSTRFHHLVENGLRSMSANTWSASLSRTIPGYVVQAARYKLLVQGIILEDEIPAT